MSLFRNWLQREIDALEAAPSGASVLDPLSLWFHPPGLSYVGQSVPYPTAYADSYATIPVAVLLAPGGAVSASIGGPAELPSMILYDMQLFLTNAAGTEKAVFSANGDVPVTGANLVFGGGVSGQIGTDLSLDGDSSVVSTAGGMFFGYLEIALRVSA